MRSHGHSSGRKEEPLPPGGAPGVPPPRGSRGAHAQQTGPPPRERAGGVGRPGAALPISTASAGSSRTQAAPLDTTTLPPLRSWAGNFLLRGAELLVDGSGPPLANRMGIPADWIHAGAQPLVASGDPASPEGAVTVQSSLEGAAWRLGEWGEQRHSMCSFILGVYRRLLPRYEWSPGSLVRAGGPGVIGVSDVVLVWRWTDALAAGGSSSWSNRPGALPLVSSPTWGGRSRGKELDGPRRCLAEEAKQASVLLQVGFVVGAAHMLVLGSACLVNGALERDHRHWG